MRQESAERPQEEAALEECYVSIALRDELALEREGFRRGNGPESRKQACGFQNKAVAGRQVGQRGPQWKTGPGQRC